MLPPPHDVCLVEGRYEHCLASECEEHIAADPERGRPQLCARSITKYAYEVGGLSNVQIAEILKFDQSTIATRVQQILRALQKRVAK